jgi:hypothetical protein
MQDNNSDINYENEIIKEILIIFLYYLELRKEY